MVKKRWKTRKMEKVKGGKQRRKGGKMKEMDDKIEEEGK